MYLRRQWHELGYVAIVLLSILAMFALPVLAVTFEEAGVWTEQSPGAPLPPPRLFHTLANVGEGQVLLFGGAELQSDSVVAIPSETWLYDAATDAWTQRTPAESPTKRFLHAMASLGDGRVLLFGGGNEEDGQNNETWVYDRGDDTWTRMSPPTSPSARAGHAMASIGGDQVLLFGGADAGETLEDTWVYDFSDDAWTQLTPSIAPSPRAYHSMVSFGTDWVFLFGGGDYIWMEAVACHPEIWFFDLSDGEWERDAQDVPEGRYFTGMAELGFAHVVLHGGSGDSTYGDTWLYIPEEEWVEDNPATSPGLRMGHAMAFLSGTRVLLFGGWDGSDLRNDAWIYETEPVPAIIISPTFGLETDENGGTATFTIRAATPPLTDITIPLGSTDLSEGTVPASVTLPAESTDPVTVTITGLPDDLADGDVVYTIVTGNPSGGGEFYDAMGSEDVADVDVTNLDTDAPRMEVLGKETAIPNGDTTPTTADGTRFASTPRGSRVSQTFTILNIGELDLELTGDPLVELTGSPDFAVTVQPSPTTVSQGETAEFTIQCRPSGDEASVATVSIASNDAAAPYTFTIRCTGTTAPEITVFGNGRIIPNGDVTPSSEEHTEFTSVSGLSVTRTFEIENSGTEELLLSGGPDYVTIDHPQFAVSRQPEREIGVGRSRTFDVTFHPNGPSTIEATLRIGNSDPDEDPYEFLVRGIAPSTEGPWPNAGPDQTVGVGERVVLDGSGSRGTSAATASGRTEPQGALTYRWAFATRSVDGGSPAFLIPTGSQCMSSCQSFDRALASFVADMEGEYTLALTITDDQGRTATDEVTITAVWNQGSNDFRVDEIVIAPNPSSGSVTVRFEGVGTPDRVTLSVFDLAGNLLWEGADTNTSSLSWNGRTSDGVAVPNGAYVAVAVFSGNGQIYTERIIVVIHR